jgi:hypothetical protein
MNHEPQSLCTRIPAQDGSNEAGVRSIFWLKQRIANAPNNATYVDFPDIKELTLRKATATEILRLRTTLETIDILHCSPDSCVYADRRLRVRLAGTRFTMQKLIYTLCANVGSIVCANNTRTQFLSIDVHSACPCPAYRIIDGQVEQQCLTPNTQPAVPNYELCCVNPHHCFVKTPLKKRSAEVLVEKFHLTDAMEAEHRCALLGGVERDRERVPRTQTPAKRPRLFDEDKLEIFYQLAMVDSQRRRLIYK